MQLPEIPGWDFCRPLLPLGQVDGGAFLSDLSYSRHPMACRKNRLHEVQATHEVRLKRVGAKVFGERMRTTRVMEKGSLKYSNT